MRGDLLFFDMENVYSEDYAGVSPRKVNCWQKIWGGLIPTYEPKRMDQSRVSCKVGSTPTTKARVYDIQRMD